MCFVSRTDQFLVSFTVRQRNRRSKGEDVTSPKGTTHISQENNHFTPDHTHLNQDLSNVLSNGDVTGYDLNDLIMPSLDTTMTCIDDSDPFNWNNNSGLTFNRDGDDRTQDGSSTSPTLSRDEGKESLTTQLMKLSNRTIDATRELECAVVTTPLTVNSPVINEAFAAANALVRIINSLPLADITYGSSQSLCRDESERQLPIEYTPIFMALASHQHVLSLFRAVCDSIKRSLGSIVQGTEPQYHNLHGDGSSSAQFIMVLQLIMHLLNRIGRSLRLGSRSKIDQHDFAFRQDTISSGDESGCLKGIVDSAHFMLGTLPEEHIKLSRVIQELQASIEEGVHVAPWSIA